MAERYHIGCIEAPDKARGFPCLGDDRYNPGSEGCMTLHVTMEIAEDGWIVVECPALPGCVSQGRNEDEARTNIKDAIEAWMWAEDQKALHSAVQAGSA